MLGVSRIAFLSAGLSFELSALGRYQGAHPWVVHLCTDIELSDSQVLEVTVLEPRGRVSFKALCLLPQDIAERRGRKRAGRWGKEACSTACYARSCQIRWLDMGRRKDRSMALKTPLERLRHRRGHILKAENEDRVRLEATVLKVR